LTTSLGEGARSLLPARKFSITKEKSRITRLGDTENMDDSLSRRSLLQKAVAGAGGAAFGASVPSKNNWGSTAQAAPGVAKQNVNATSSRVESLIQLIIETPRNQLLPSVGQAIKNGVTYPDVLAALLLAGAREIQPRPSVGFKFHAVLAVISYHLIGRELPGRDRWLPVFWGLDYFKSAQASDEREGDWVLGPVADREIPRRQDAAGSLTEAMSNWDESAADVAAAAVARQLKPSEAFELFYSLGARDFRSIGHKAIYVMGADRVLKLIGWQYAEPVMRSLAYALLMHEGDNPANRDDEADRPWRRNLQIVSKIRKEWRTGRPDEQATRELLEVFRNGSPDDAADAVLDRLNSGVAPRSIWDAIFCGAAELQLRLPNIVSLHAVTTTRAIHHSYRSTQVDRTRRLLLLQNAALLPMFRGGAAQRGKLQDAAIDQLEANSTGGSSEAALKTLMNGMSADRHRAAEQLLGYLSAGNPAAPLTSQIQNIVALKGRGAHDFKFASAALEGFECLSPPWRDRFLACGAMHFRGANDPDNETVAATRKALGS
jgi:hypothetical protein